MIFAFSVEMHFDINKIFNLTGKSMKQKEFRTARLIIRPLRLTDYPAWLEVVTNSLPAHNRWDRGPLPASKRTLSQFKKLLAKLKQKAKHDDSYWYGVFEKKTGALVGAIDFDVFKRSTHQFANFGYTIYNRHWGKGFGQESALAGLKIGFKQLNLNRLEAAINLDNKKSIRLAKAIGMRREGIKKRYWFEFGEWVDHLIYVANPEDLNLRAKKPF